MTTQEALITLEKMPEANFQQFFNWLPERVKLLVISGMVNWKIALPDWYIKYVKEL